jgi:hypothetical protein
MIAKNFIPPLSDELLTAQDFFCLYPFDGGGRFIHEGIIGTIKNGEIFEKITKEAALAEFGNFPEIDFGKFERWRSIEKSCWINRFYFLVPLAIESRKRMRGDIARQAVDAMLFFIRNFPPPIGKEEIINHTKRVFRNRDINYNGKTYEEYTKDESDVEYIWFDFQPASRIIHFIYAMYFLKDFQCASEEEWKEIERSLKLHADVIAVQERVSELKPGNHQSLRGLALLFAAAFFKGEDFAGEYLAEGLRICNYHVENDYFSDGVLKEISPSYHVFETWHIRDACLLSEKYGFDISQEARGVIKKAASFVKSLIQPDGFLPVINDGYALSLDAFLESLKSFLREDSAESVDYFKDAGIAFYKDEDRYLLLDFSVFPGEFSHYHGGKNSFVFWSSGKAFFIDSACCSYDDHLFAEWYKTVQAHSSLLVDGGGDCKLKGSYEWIKHAACECCGWEKRNGTHFISSRLTSEAENWETVEWERSFEVNPEGGIAILDRIEAPENKELCLVFNLHPDVCIERQEGGCLKLSNKNAELYMDIDCEENLKLEISEGKVFSGFMHLENKRILAKVNVALEEVFIKTQITKINQ